MAGSHAALITRELLLQTAQVDHNNLDLQRVALHELYAAAGHPSEGELDVVARLEARVLPPYAHVLAQQCGQ